MSSSIFTSEVVKVLINDGYVIEQRVHFTDLLGTPPAERKQWEDLHVMGRTSGYEHFAKLIEEWVQRTTNPSLGQLKEILISCRCISTKDSLKLLGDDGTIIKINQQSSKTSKAISFGIMQPTTYFTGRDAEVQQLSELFLNQSPPKIVVISGMGGQGKTELCRQFIQTQKGKNYPPVLTWLSGDNATNLTLSVVDLAEDLQIPTANDGKPIPLNKLLIQVADNISVHSSSSGWLVVIDNVDEVYPEFKQAVDLLIRQGAFVLVTTRRIDVLSGQAKQMKLGVMKEDEAHNLVRQCLNQPPIDQDVHHLCHELGSHALALRQAVAYINAQQVENRASYGIKDYLNDFTKDRALLNDEDNFVDGYEQTIFIIVTQSINTIHKHGRLGQTAAELMEILCLVRPDGISVQCLKKFQAIIDEGSDMASTLESMNEDLHKALLLLKKYSMISYDEPVISIHRLIQKVAKIHVGNEANRTILKNIEPKQCSKEELQQIIHIWEQADTETVRLLPNLPDRMFMRMVDISLVLEMKPFAQKNHQLLTELLGPGDEYTLGMGHNMAFALSENGDYEAALTKCQEVLEKERLVLGEDHPDTLATASQLADIFFTLDRFEEALEWNERVLEAQVRVLGTNHEDTMITRNNMALVLEDLGRTGEALTLFNQVLDWSVKNHGHSHPGTLITRHNMATILYDQGRLEEAKKELEAVLTLRVEVLGDEHADTLLTKRYLATALWKFGMREEALKMNQEVLLSQEKVYGPHHPDTIYTRNQITEWESMESV